MHWHQRDVASTRLAPGSLTPTDRAVVAAALHARSRGLAVMVFPIVWVEKRAVGKWRGTLQPVDRDAWWASYERFVVHYAKLADIVGAEWLSIGSELGSTETWQDRWYHLISRVESSCHAALLYSANWDHFGQVSFWRRLAAIGVNGYQPIAVRDDSSVGEMATAWRRAGKKLIASAAAIGLPLVLTEVGYLSRNGGAVKPWDYGSKGGLDLEEQRRAYAAFVRVWGGSSELMGAIIWDWSGAGGPRDRGYTPRGKPAEKVLRRFFSIRRSK